MVEKHFGSIEALAATPRVKSEQPSSINVYGDIYILVREAALNHYIRANLSMAQLGLDISIPTTRENLKTQIKDLMWSKQTDTLGALALSILQAKQDPLFIRVGCVKTQKEYVIIKRYNPRTC